MDKNDITASDILHLPHIILIKRKGESRVDMIECETGEEAHANVYNLITEEVEKLYVCVRVRTLTRPIRKEPQSAL